MFLIVDLVQISVLQCLTFASKSGDFNTSLPSSGFLCFVLKEARTSLIHFFNTMHWIMWKSWQWPKRGSVNMILPLKTERMSGEKLI